MSDDFKSFDFVVRVENIFTIDSFGFYRLKMFTVLNFETCFVHNNDYNNVILINFQPTYKFGTQEQVQR